MGSLPWSEKDAGNKVAKIIMWRYLIDMKQPPPHVALRSHNHRRADSGGNYEVFANLMPAWTVKTEFAYRIGAENSISDIGSDLFLCDNGQYQHTPWKWKAKEARRVWQVM